MVNAQDVQNTVSFGEEQTGINGYTGDLVVHTPVNEDTWSLNYIGLFYGD